MADPTLVTDPDRIAALLAFKKDQIEGGKTQAVFADMGICTHYQLIFDLGEAMTYQEAERINADVANTIEKWLRKQSNDWLAQHPGDYRGRRLPSGGLSVARRKKIPSTGLPKPVFVIEYTESLPAIHMDQNVLDKSLFADLCALYEAIVCECGSFPALIVVGNHQWHATMIGNNATFTPPVVEPQGQFQVTAIQGNSSS